MWPVFTPSSKKETLSPPKPSRTPPRTPPRTSPSTSNATPSPEQGAKPRNKRSLLPTPRNTSLPTPASRFGRSNEKSSGGEKKGAADVALLEDNKMSKLGSASPNGGWYSTCSTEMATAKLTPRR